MSESEDREVTLGTGALLGIFFALALLCAVFFGLGYALGRRGGEGADSAKAARPAPASVTRTTVAPRSTDPPPQLRPSATGVAGGTPAPARTTTHPAPAPESAAKPVRTADSEPGSGNAGVMVQLMAAAHAEDADVLAAALRKRGYTAIVRNEADHLFHVQIGPFPTRTDADAMRKKLQADGYNPILK